MMFDPTIYDNLKVALENQIYDLDNLSREIHIVNRLDRLELSVMSREFAIQFTLVDDLEVIAEIRLEASLKDLAAEILEVTGESPGCTLLIRFYVQLTDIATQCKQIEAILLDIWQPILLPVQTLSFVYNQEPARYLNTIEIRFNRKINEEQMGDIPDLLAHAIRTLEELAKVWAE